MWTGVGGGGEEFIMISFLVGSVVDVMAKVREETNRSAIGKMREIDRRKDEREIQKGFG
jgi:hypothetical protein